MEWIYFVIIFFYIVNAISKATKKKQLEGQQKLEALKQMNRRVEARPVPPPEPKPVRSNFEHATEALTDIPIGDVMRFIDDKMNARKAREEEASYETVDYDQSTPFEPTRAERPAVDRESMSSFHSAEGMRSDLHSMSKFASAPQYASATFDFGHKRRERIDFKLRGAELRKYVIVSEILGKPKALRKK